MLKKIWKFLSELWKENCPVCKWKKCVSFYYEEAFSQNNIHRCSKCEENYIIL